MPADTTDVLLLIDAPAEQFARIRAAVLINPARAGLVDEQAFIRCMREGWIRAASCDVHYAYPLPPEHPLWSMPNVVLAPHISGPSASTNFLDRIYDIFAKNLARLVAGEPLLNQLSAAQLRGTEAGGRLHDSLPGYATGCVSDHPWDELLRKFDRYREAGFHAAKVASGWFDAAAAGRPAPYGGLRRRLPVRERPRAAAASSRPGGAATPRTQGTIPVRAGLR